MATALLVKLAESSWKRVAVNTTRIVVFVKCYESYPFKGDSVPEFMAPRHPLPPELVVQCRLCNGDAVKTFQCHLCCMASFVLKELGECTPESIRMVSEWIFVAYAKLVQKRQSRFKATLTDDEKLADSVRRHLADASNALTTANAFAKHSGIQTKADAV
jgi:hypothetical protein